MPNLSQVVDELRTRIAKFRSSRKLNEENTKATLIEPVLRALGWNLEDLDEVNREFKVKPQDKPVDYALLLVRTPRLLIEAKALGEALDDRRWASQIMGYAGVVGAEWVVLTNGDEYRVYNAHAAVSVDEKLFRTMRVSDAATRPAETLALLDAATLKENRLQILWKAYFVDKRVRAALSEIFSPAPDPAIVRLVKKKTQNLHPNDIRTSLARVVAQFDFPVEAEPPGKAPVGKPSPRTDVTPADLIRARLISPPLALVRKYKGTELTARIESNGTVTFAGKSYSSLSMAAGVARTSAGMKSPGRSYPQTNGWSFWQFHDADGALKEIDVLRQRFLGLGKLRRVGEGPAAAAE
ncbi:MAG: type I restriction enzyme HsdR N-terminal domain-containing protein [Planctomycetes bacterium]|nr:type I restriction enzyme HsdR N-terminal domain-containing protein [Planctomycetota bacterium]